MGYLKGRLLVCPKPLDDGTTGVQHPSAEGEFFLTIGFFIEILVKVKFAGIAQW